MFQSCFIISHVLMEFSADPLDIRPLKYVQKIWVDLPWQPISMNNDIRTLVVLHAILVPMRRSWAEINRTAKKKANHDWHDKHSDSEVTGKEIVEQTRLVLVVLS